jgi:hypothetical protein
MATAFALGTLISHLVSFLGEHAPGQSPEGVPVREAQNVSK